MFFFPASYFRSPPPLTRFPFLSVFSSDTTNIVCLVSFANSMVVSFISFRTFAVSQNLKVLKKKFVPHKIWFWIETILMKVMKNIDMCWETWVLCHMWKIIRSLPIRVLFNCVGKSSKVSISIWPTLCLKQFSNFREKTLKITYAQLKTDDWLAHAFCVWMCL